MRNRVATKTPAATIYITLELSVVELSVYRGGCVGTKVLGSPTGIVFA